MPCKSTHSVIINPGVTPIEFWSNSLGWTDLEHATLFTADEREEFRPPQAGIWVSLGCMINAGALASMRQKLGSDVAVTS